VRTNIFAMSAIVAPIRSLAAVLQEAFVSVAVDIIHQNGEVGVGTKGSHAPIISSHPLLTKLLAHNLGLGLGIALGIGRVPAIITNRAPTLVGQVHFQKFQQCRRRGEPWSQGKPSLIGSSCCEVGHTTQGSHSDSRRARVLRSRCGNHNPWSEEKEVEVTKGRKLWANKAGSEAEGVEAGE
jgi:hypothetical protein